LITVFWQPGCSIHIKPTLRYAVSIEYWNVTNGQRDRRTDKIPISISRVGLLTRDKNCEIFFARVLPNT